MVTYNKGVRHCECRTNPNRFLGATVTPLQENTPCVCGIADCQIPHGQCHCGCGQTTILHRQNRPGMRVKGMPQRFIFGHVLNPTKGTRLAIALPFKVDGVYCRLIPLTRDQYAIVDADDYEWLCQRKWNAHWADNTRSFYACCGRSPMVAMHREILGLKAGDPQTADHANHLTLDNRRANIRIATRRQQSINRRLRRDNTSGIVGIYAVNGKWVARIGNKTLGTFSGRDMADAAYCAAAKEMWGEFTPTHVLSRLGEATW